VLRVAYPNFIHYELYVPNDAATTKYVGVMVQFKTGLARLGFYAKYLGGIRWLFHGDFSNQDHWMVAETDAPPERLYRPDVSLLEWRRLVEEGNPFHRDGSGVETPPADVADGQAVSAVDSVAEREADGDTTGDATGRDR
jgi:hypothetical protein